MLNPDFLDFKQEVAATTSEHYATGEGVGYNLRSFAWLFV
jgi:hypothetical protein